MEQSALLLKFNELSRTFYASSSQSFQKILGVMDEVFLAAGIVLVGWLVGSWVKDLVAKIGEKLKVTKISEKIGFVKLLKRANISAPPSRIIGEFLKGYILTVFLIGAAKILGFTQISEFLDSVIAYIPNVLIVLLIVLFGIGIGDTMKAIIENTLRLPDSRAAKTLALTARYIVITFSIMAALFQLNIAADLVEILFTGFIAMITIAGGLAFGLGGKEIVREFLEDLKKKPKNSKMRMVPKES